MIFLLYEHVLIKIFYKKMHQISDKGINLGYLGSVDTAYDIEPVIDFFQNTINTIINPNYLSYKQ